MKVGLEIDDFEFITCKGSIYKLGGHLTQVPVEGKKKLPPFNWVVVTYNARDQKGTMQFSNAE